MTFSRYGLGMVAIMLCVLASTGVGRDCPGRCDPARMSWDSDEVLPGLGRLLAGVARAWAGPQATARPPP